MEAHRNLSCSGKKSTSIHVYHYLPVVVPPGPAPTVGGIPPWWAVVVSVFAHNREAGLQE